MSYSPYNCSNPALPNGSQGLVRQKCGFDASMLFPCTIACTSTPVTVIAKAVAFVLHTSTATSLFGST